MNLLARVKVNKVLEGKGIDQTIQWKKLDEEGNIVEDQLRDQIFRLQVSRAPLCRKQEKAPNPEVYEHQIEQVHQEMVTLEQQWKKEQEMIND